MSVCPTNGSFIHPKPAECTKTLVSTNDPSVAHPRHGGSRGIWALVLRLVEAPPSPTGLRKGRPRWMRRPQHQGDGGSPNGIAMRQMKLRPQRQEVATWLAVGSGILSLRFLAAL